MVIIIMIIIIDNNNNIIIIWYPTILWFVHVLSLFIVF